MVLPVIFCDYGSVKHSEGYPFAKQTMEQLGLWSA